MARGHFAGADVPLDARDLMQQPHHAARQSVGVGDSIARQAPAKIAGLADIKHARIRAAEKVNSRRGGCLPEEIIAKALHQRSRLRPKP